MRVLVVGAIKILHKYCSDRTTFTKFQWLEQVASIFDPSSLAKKAFSVYHSVSLLSYFIYLFTVRDLSPEKDKIYPPTRFLLTFLLQNNEMYIE